MIERETKAIQFSEANIKKAGEKVISRLKPRVLAYPIIGALANLGYADLNTSNNAYSSEYYLAWGAAAGLVYLAYNTIKDINAMKNGELLTPNELEK